MSKNILKNYIQKLDCLKTLCCLIAKYPILFKTKYKIVNKNTNGTMLNSTNEMLILKKNKNNCKSFY